MASNDVQYVTVEMFNAGIAEIKTSIAELRTDITELRAEVREARYDIRTNEHDIAHLQTSVYWGFALIALGAAFAPTLLDIRRDRKQEYKERREYVTRPEMEEAISEAVAKALRMK